MRYERKHSSPITHHPSRVRVEVVYALPEEQALIELEVEEGATVREVIERSGLAQRYPQMEVVPGRVGIFGKAANLNAVVREGDRVEIYRPLLVDPKEARRARAPARRKSRG